MHVCTISSVGGIQNSASSHWKQGQQGFAALKSALESGDIDAAKSALSGMKFSHSEHSNSPLARVARAVQSGDLATAQQTMQDLMAARTGHRHNHTEPPSTAAPPPAGTTDGGVSLVA